MLNGVLFHVLDVRSTVFVNIIDSRIGRVLQQLWKSAIQHIVHVPMQLVEDGEFSQAAHVERIAAVIT